MKKSKGGIRIEAIISMASRLGLDLEKFGYSKDFRDDIWDSPLSEFIRMTYQRRFGKSDLDRR